MLLRCFARRLLDRFRRASRREPLRPRPHARRLLKGFTAYDAINLHFRPVPYWSRDSSGAPAVEIRYWWNGVPMVEPPLTFDQAVEAVIDMHPDLEVV